MSMTDQAGGEPGGRNSGNSGGRMDGRLSSFFRPDLLLRSKLLFLSSRGARDVFRDAPAACFLTDNNWVCFWGNRASQKLLGHVRSVPVKDLLARCFAVPDVLLASIARGIETDGYALQDLDRHAERFRVTVRRIKPDIWLWRLEARYCWRLLRKNGNYSFPVPDDRLDCRHEPCCT